VYIYHSDRPMRRELALSYSQWGSQSFSTS